MNNRQAFEASTEEEIKAALKKAWDDNGQCNTCGWWSAFYEVVSDLEPETSDLKEWHTHCHSKDRDEDDSWHKGCFIYPVFKGLEVVE